MPTPPSLSPPGIELPSQLVPPVGLVDLRVDQRRRAGWTRLPTLIGERYTGRAYIG